MPNFADAITYRDIAGLIHTREKVEIQGSILVDKVYSHRDAWDNIESLAKARRTNADQWLHNMNSKPAIESPVIGTIDLWLIELREDPKAFRNLFETALQNREGK